MTPKIRHVVVNILWFGGGGGGVRTRKCGSGIHDWVAQVEVLYTRWCVAHLFNRCVDGMLSGGKTGGRVDGSQSERGWRGEGLGHSREDYLYTFMTERRSARTPRNLLLACLGPSHFCVTRVCDMVLFL